MKAETKAKRRVTLSIALLKRVNRLEHDAIDVGKSPSPAVTPIQRYLRDIRVNRRCYVKSHHLLLSSQT
jgi:hypothetical protein